MIIIQKRRIGSQMSKNDYNVFANPSIRFPKASAGFNYH